MTDVNFRISGAVSPDLTTDEINETGVQVMHQGIGFDRVPVANVPPDDFGDSLNSETIASGIFMTYMPQGFEQGKYYPKGSVVGDGTWQMIATQLTLDYPFPVLAGDQNWGIAAYTPATQSNLSTVHSGHAYTMNEDVYITALRIWITQVTADTTYRIIIIETISSGGRVTTTIENPTLIPGAWSTVALLDTISRLGTKYEIFIDALNSGADNVITGGWTYTGQNNTGAPPVQSWNHNNAQGIVRIDKTDLDGTDRTAELIGIGLNSTIIFADTNNPSAFYQYRTLTDLPADQLTYIEFIVVLQEVGEGGPPIGTTTMTATVPIAQATEYAEQAGVVPAYTQDITVTGTLSFNGIDQGGAANTYGVDLQIEGITGSPDWDVFSYIAP
jgi:hypothetical protein